MLERCYALFGQPFCDGLAGAFVVVLVVALLIVVCAIVLLVLAARQVRKLDIPENADFFQTLRMIPITVPLALDMLDLVFDIFAAPLAWVILELLGLKALQLVTVTEGLIPGTQPIPTLTLAWVLARLTKPTQPSSLELRLRERERQLDARTERRSWRGTGDDPDSGYGDYTDVE